MRVAASRLLCSSRFAEVSSPHYRTNRRTRVTLLAVIRIALLKIPYHLGRERVEVGLGPDLLCEWAAHYLEGQDVSILSLDGADPFPNEVSAIFELNALAASRVRTAISGGIFPLVLSGNCSACIGTLAGLAATRPGMVW